MQIRKMRDGEEDQLVAVFREAVHQLNRVDYSAEQLNAWAPEALDVALVGQRIKANAPFVVVLDGRLVAFADIQTDGYIDQFFCHPDYSGRGIAGRLFGRLLQHAMEHGIETMYANVSITARPFFEGRGFTVVAERRVQLRGQQLTNYRMVCNCENAN